PQTLVKRQRSFSRAQRAKRSAVTPSHRRVLLDLCRHQAGGIDGSRASWLISQFDEGRRSSQATTALAAFTGRIEHHHDAAVPRGVTFKGASFPRPHTTCIWAVSSVQGLIRRNVIVQGSHVGWQRENARVKTYRTLPSVSGNLLRASAKSF